LIAHQVEQGILPQHIVLLGFSQGGALALHTALHSHYPLGAVAGLSSYLPFANSLTPTARTELPIFLAHGLFDPIVPVTLAQNALRCLQSAGFKPTWETFPMAHTLCGAQLIKLGAWLKKSLTILKA
jgi:phospholipase/carboxylesterase